MVACRRNGSLRRLGNPRHLGNIHILEVSASEVALAFALELLLYGLWHVLLVEHALTYAKSIAVHLLLIHHDAIVLIVVGNHEV